MYITYKKLPENGNYSAAIVEFDSRKKIKCDEDLKEVVKQYPHTLVAFKDNIRNTANLLEGYGLILDFDSGQSINSFIESTFKNINYYLYTSRHHTKEKHKYHIILPFERTVTDVLKLRKLQKAIVLYAQLENMVVDRAVKDAARFFYPSREENKPPKEDFIFIHNDVTTYVDSLEETLLKLYRKAETDRDTKTLVQTAVTDANLELVLRAATDSIIAYNKEKGIDYSDWFLLGMALTSVDNGEDLFLEISGATEPTKELEHREFFLRLKRDTHSISIGTFFYLATQMGFVRPKTEMGTLDLIVKDVMAGVGKQFNNIIYEGLHFINRAFTYEVLTYKENKVTLSSLGIPEKLLKTYCTDAVQYLELYSYVIHKHSLMQPLRVSRVAGMLPEDISFTSAKKVLEVSEPQLLNYNNITGEIKVLQPPVQKTRLDVEDKEASDWIMEVLKEIFITEQENYLEFILDFMAQFVFEHRVDAKVGIFLVGERGTGKGVFVEQILGALYNVEMHNYSNSDNFTSFKESLKVIKADEANLGGKYDLKKLYSDMKETSGAVTTSVRKMRTDAYQIQSTAYFIVSQNSKYVYIGEKASRENQFFVCQFGESEIKTDSKKWVSLEYSPKKVKRRLFSFIETVLFPRYVNKIMPNRHRYRYGIEVPKTKAYTRLARQQHFAVEDEIEVFRTTLMQVYHSEQFRETILAREPALELEVHALLKHAVLTAPLRKAIMYTAKVKFSLSAFKEILGEYTTKVDTFVNMKLTNEKGRVKRIGKRGVNVKQFIETEEVEVGEIK